MRFERKDAGKMPGLPGEIGEALGAVEGLEGGGLGRVLQAGEKRPGGPALHGGGRTGGPALHG